MAKKLVVVTIPIYKKEIDENEKISLTQCFKVLSNYPIVFFAPKSLDVSYYETFCNPLGFFSFERFDDEYFSGIPGYNKLMLSKSFYQRFVDFEYLFIYQLDAFVFRDELAYWCKKGYFYIGAPYIFVDLDSYPIKFLTKYRALLKWFNRKGMGFYSYRHVGNGGLSLRHIPKTLQLLTWFRKSADNWTTLMEDNFFCYWGNVFFFYFNLAKEHDALRFSLELDAERSYNFAGKHVPFGVHAFMRYEPNFWIPLIEMEGYELNSSLT